MSSKLVGKRIRKVRPLKFENPEFWKFLCQLCVVERALSFIAD